MTAGPDAARDASLRLEDGRRLYWREYGARGGDPLIALHGLPGSRLKFSTCGRAALRLGLRIIAPDRWGYGNTDPHPSPSLTAFAGDMRILADHLGIGRFAVMGVSGGGPYAAAIAATLTTRVTAAALVSPVGRIAGDSSLRIGAFHRFCFGPLARSPAALRAVFAPFRSLLLRAPPLGMAISMARVPGPDRRVLEVDGVRERLTATFVEGLRGGSRGPCIDMQLFGRPWDVDLDAVSAAVRVWIGDEDRNVPIEAAVRLSELMPGGDLVRLHGAGHLWVALNYETVLEWIAQRPSAAEAPR